MQDVVVEYSLSELEFYAFGYMENSEFTTLGEVDEHLTSLRSKVANCYNSTRIEKWTYPFTEKTYAIIMHCGDLVWPIPPKSAIMPSLELIHKAGWYHRDIRTPNIMDFGERGIQIIDFGFACRKDDDNTGFEDTPSAILKILNSIKEIENCLKFVPEWKEYYDEAFLNYLCNE